MLATRATPPILAALALLLATPARQTFSPFETTPAPQLNDHGTYTGTFSPFETSARDVIVPGAFSDALPWPHGMVIEPPETHDRIAIAAPLPDVLSALLAPLLPPSLLL
jgi:hypothetical protein